MAVHISDHPLIWHKLTLMRDRHTNTKDFRELLDEIAMLMGYEATRNLPVRDINVTTPICTTKSRVLDTDTIIIIPILRSGLGMVQGLLHLIPFAKVGHIGLYRDHETLKPVEYYSNLPPQTENAIVFIVDPMLATGGSASAATSNIKKQGYNDLRLMSLIASPDGIATMQKEHPDVDIYVAMIDEKLNDKAYIVPGLGDAGDRLFGTYDLD